MSGLSYLALGHYHSAYSAGRTAYAGCIEAATYKDPVGSVRIVEFEDGLSNPKGTIHPCGVLRWTDLKPQCATIGDVHALCKDIDALGERKDQVICITPALNRDAEGAAIEALDHLRDELEGEVFALDWREDAYERAMQDDGQLLPPGIFEVVQTRLKAAVEGSGELEPNVARAAIVELHRIAREARR